MRLKHVLRSSDVRGRFGGDEFVIVLPDTPAAGAAYVAEALRREIESLEVTIEGAIVRVTASVGVASAVPEELDPNGARGPRRSRALRRQGRRPEHRLRRQSRPNTLSAAPAEGSGSTGPWGPKVPRFGLLMSLLMSR